MRNDKLTFQVGKSFVEFLAGLEKPLQLNEMRAMKEANYTKLRSIIMDPDQYGDEVLSLIAKNKAELGLGEGVYEAVYGNFWEIYCKKP
mmetsp:Transcript_26407/g.25562  ORF Transcript_26407/g.25562 Transcript_26407/m.25562 type:complete len:89 (+) Transcript_26407:1417-1683(+)